MPTDFFGNDSRSSGSVYAAAPRDLPASRRPGAGAGIPLSSSGGDDLQHFRSGRMANGTIPMGLSAGVFAGGVAGMLVALFIPLAFVATLTIFLGMAAGSLAGVALVWMLRSMNHAH